MGKPFLPNLEPLVGLGIDPSTGLPIKLGARDSELHKNIVRVLRVVDEQDAIRRYTWYNLPDGLDSELVERILYYKGQAMFFYEPTTERFYFLPFAAETLPDVYGRYNTVRPMCFGNASDEKNQKIMGSILSAAKRKVQHSMMLEDATVSDQDNLCVLCYDYCKQISQTTLPRQVLNEPIIDVEAKCIPFMRTNLISQSGIRGVRVDNADAAENVDEVSGSIQRKALNGEQFVALTSALEYQELTSNAGAKPQDFMEAMQELDNFRLALYGLDNGGLFEKKAHMLQEEEEKNSSTTGLVYQDGLLIRQRFCDIVNSIWGLGIWCDASESVLGDDIDGDGLAFDEEESMEGMEYDTDTEL